MALAHHSYSPDRIPPENHNQSEYESLSLHAVQAAQVLAAASLRPLNLEVTTPDFAKHKRKRHSKTSSDGDQSRSTPKSIKHKTSQEYSDAAKKKWESSRRAGQACDRCKARKIKCDGLAGGCSQCIRANHGCFTTDRLSGKVTSRGYIEKLEHENHVLQQRVQELESRLLQNGLLIEPTSGYPPSPSREQPSSASRNEWANSSGSQPSAQSNPQQPHDWNSTPSVGTWNGSASVTEEAGWQ